MYEAISDSGFDFHFFLIIGIVGHFSSTYWLLFRSIIHLKLLNLFSCYCRLYHLDINWPIRYILFRQVLSSYSLSLPLLIVFLCRSFLAWRSLISWFLLLLLYFWDCSHRHPCSGHSCGGFLSHIFSGRFTVWVLHLNVYSIFILFLYMLWDKVSFNSSTCKSSVFPNSLLCVLDIVENQLDMLDFFKGYLF